MSSKYLSKVDVFPKSVPVPDILDQYDMYL